MKTFIRIPADHCAPSVPVIVNGRRTDIPTGKEVVVDMSIVDVLIGSGTPFSLRTEEEVVEEVGEIEAPDPDLAVMNPQASSVSSDTDPAEQVFNSAAQSDEDSDGSAAQSDEDSDDEETN